MITIACQLKGVNFMFKKRVLVTVLSCILVFLIMVLFESKYSYNNMFTRMVVISDNKALEADVLDNNTNIKENTDTEENISLQGDANTLNSKTNVGLVNLEIAEAKKAVVYDGMTVEELASKLERSLKNELSGKGYLYASYSLKKGVDPYLAVAISLEETGCNWNCSRLVKTCNNVGGMKGSGCGSYGAFPTLDDGIKAFIDNIYRNYVRYGLNTADEMNPKYAANPKWSTNVNAYITKIKNK